MRHTKVLSFIMLGLIVCVMALGRPTYVQAIREVTPTVPAPTSEPTGEAQTTPQSTSEGTLDEQIQAAYETFGEGKYDDVVDMTSTIVEFNPDAAEAYLLRGMAYMQLNNFTRAIDDYTRTIRILPYEWRAYTFRAVAYTASGKASEALDDYDKAIDLNPRYAAAYTGRSQLLNAQGDSENAQIDQLIAEGVTLFERQDVEGAIDRYTDAIEIDSTEHRVAGAYYNRGLAYYTVGQFEEAITDYTAALELAPNMHDLYLGRGIAYVSVEDTANAGVDFAKRIELLASDVTEETLEVGKSAEIEMSYGKVYHVAIQGRAGQHLTIQVLDLAVVGVDPLIALLDPEGTPIAGDDDSGGELDAKISIELPADGTYTLVVSHANGGYEGLLSVLVNED